MERCAKNVGFSLAFSSLLRDRWKFRELSDSPRFEFERVSDFSLFLLFPGEFLFFKLCATEINATKGGINGDRENNAGQTGI